MATDDAHSSPSGEMSPEGAVYAFTPALTAGAQLADRVLSGDQVAGDNVPTTPRAAGRRSHPRDARQGNAGSGELDHLQRMIAQDLGGTVLNGSADGPRRPI